MLILPPASSSTNNIKGECKSEREREKERHTVQKGRENGELASIRHTGKEISHWNILNGEDDVKGTELSTENVS